jgi:AcrR family transcriptional regulator
VEVRVRADAQRNYERIVAAADELVARDGADVSLEEVARRAGVGSATLHRRFPGRQALLDAVFADRVDAVCARGMELYGSGAPGALVTWLFELVRYTTVNRGLASSMIARGEYAIAESCGTKLLATAGKLLDQARAQGLVRDTLGSEDLLLLVSGICMAADDDPERAARLFDHALLGIKT